LKFSKLLLVFDFFL